MPRARKYLISVADTPYYHVTSRCVRRAFLCGVDRFSGQSYEHRRDWIEARIRLLSSLFTVEIAAYAVMSNHYHLVVRLAPDEARSWSGDEVLNRWCTLFKGPLLVQRFRAGEPLSSAERGTVNDLIAVFRRRLTSLSWFMKCLNEPIARRANAEDGCTGHFWEARFRSQALRTERALLSAMAYVDLNPVRAGIARTPEASEYTSLRARLRPDEANRNARRRLNELADRGEIEATDRPLRPLQRFADQGRGSSAASGDALPVKFRQYLSLVDMVGRPGRRGKRGRIDRDCRPILERLGLSQTQWSAACSEFEARHRNGEVSVAVA